MYGVRNFISSLLYQRTEEARIQTNTGLISLILRLHDEASSTSWLDELASSSS